MVNQIKLAILICGFSMMSSAGNLYVNNKHIVHTIVQSTIKSHKLQVTKVKLDNSKTYAYIINATNNNITKCDVNSQDGSLINCVLEVVPLLNYPVQMAIKDGYAYITNNWDDTGDERSGEVSDGGGVTNCKIDPANGELSQCVDNTIYVRRAYSVAIHNQFIYFGTWDTTQNPVMKKCEISSFDHWIVNCSNPTPYTSGGRVTGMVFNNDQVFLMNEGADRIPVSQCSIGVTGDFYGCHDYLNISQAPGPGLSSIYNGYLYMATFLPSQEGNSQYIRCVNDQCSIMSNKGVPSSSITRDIEFNGNYGYITTSDSIQKCAIDSNGILTDACTSKTFGGNIYGITFYTVNPTTK